MSPVRFGFLGAGFVAGAAMAPAVHAASGARLQAVAARDHARALRLQPCGRVHRRYADVIDDAEVDVVYINLVNSLHRPWVERALAGGKHVLCEKPLDLSYHEAAHLYDVADRADRILVEAMWYRWHPRTRRAEHLVRGGDLGEVHAVTSAFSFGGVPHGNYRLDPTLGGGALLDVGCYALSAARWALPGSPCVATAHSDYAPTGVDLHTSATLVADGATAAINASIAGDERQSLVITGNRAVLRFGSPAFTAWREPTTLRIQQPGASTIEEFPPADAYQLMVEAVVERVRGNDAWLVDRIESLEVAALVDAVRDHAHLLDPMED